MDFNMARAEERESLGAAQGGVTMAWVRTMAVEELRSGSLAVF